MSLIFSNLVVTKLFSAIIVVDAQLRYKFQKNP